MNYWAERLQRENEILYNIILNQLVKKYSKSYQKIYNDIIIDFKDLYDKLLAESADGIVKISDLYKYNQYFEIMSKLNQKLEELGLEEIKFTDQQLLEMYTKAGKIIEVEGKALLGVDFIFDDAQAAKKAISSIWCADGKNWSNRVWGNKTALQERIKKGLIDCVSQGLSKDKMVKAIKDEFNTAFYQADRIARTELTYVQNKSAADRYQANGVKKYEFLAEIDSRTSSICKEHDGKIYNFSEMKVGENCPPLHPNCRSTIIPVIE